MTLLIGSQLSVYCLKEEMAIIEAPCKAIIEQQHWFFNRQRSWFLREDFKIEPQNKEFLLEGMKSLTLYLQLTIDFRW